MTRWGIVLTNKLYMVQEVEKNINLHQSHDEMNAFESVHFVSSLLPMS